MWHSAAPGRVFSQQKINIIHPSEKLEYSGNYLWIGIKSFGVHAIQSKQKIFLGVYFKNANTCDVKQTRQQCYTERFENYLILNTLANVNGKKGLWPNRLCKLSSFLEKQYCWCVSFYRNCLCCERKQTSLKVNWFTPKIKFNSIQLRGR